MKTEAELIERIQAGEWRNYAILVDKYEAKVFNYVSYLLRNQEDAEEIVQDTFVKAFRSLHQFRGDASFSTWVIRIAHRNCLTFFRKKTPQKVSLDQVHGGKAIEGDSPTKYLDMNDRSAILKKALDQLKPEERSIVTLFYYNDHSIQEIVQVTDQSESNVKVILHRSRKKLLKILSEMGIKESTL